MICHFHFPASLLLQTYGNLLPPASYQQQLDSSSSSSSQSPDSGIVVGASFSSNDSNLSPCGNSDAPTSTSDVQTARRRSKSLPELDSPTDENASDSTPKERPASAEGVAKESKKGEDFKTSISHSAVSGADSNGQRGRLFSTPADIRGTVPLSHAPSASVPPLKGCMANTASFAIPRINYGNHAGSYGALFPNFPAYPSYNMAAMPTQSAYPPTYPYTGNTGSGTTYLGHSGPPGSTLYHHSTARPSYANYMSAYPGSMTTDCRQSSMPYSSSTLPYNSTIPLSTAHSYSANPIGGDLSHMSLPGAAAAANGYPSELDQSHAAVPSSNITNVSAELVVAPSATKSVSSSPKSVNNLVVVENDCDSTTHLGTMAPLSEQEEEERGAEKEDKKASKGSETLRYYSTRYVCIVCPSIQHHYYTYIAPIAPLRQPTRHQSG